MPYLEEPGQARPGQAKHNRLHNLLQRQKHRQNRSSKRRSQQSRSSKPPNLFSKHLLQWLP